MAYRELLLTSLVVNPANDRHGELENETAAIAQLFSAQEAHMRALARDLVVNGEVFEPPLVYPDGDVFVVADGNRRTTCLKLLAVPRRAPTIELQEFFAELRRQWVGKFPDRIECRVESDRDRVDDILYRRHTGVQGGIGQSTWTDRMKNNFVIRTGKNTGLNVADEIEKRLNAAQMAPLRKIPRSNLNRLLSAESLRNRLGISVRRGKLEFIRDEQATLHALKRVASDMAGRIITLDDVWDTESKLKYIDRLDVEGVLPGVVPNPKPSLVASPLVPIAKPNSKATKPVRWPHLIPDVGYGVVWSAHLYRHREIWEELQFKLELGTHSNAISVLLRVLLELVTDNYISRTLLSNVHANDRLSSKIKKIAEDLQIKGKIDTKYLGVLNKLQQGDAILSIDTLNRYVHSPNFNVSPEHLKMLWSTLAEYIVLCLLS